MKRLQPAEQEATRYLEFKVHSEEEIELSELVESFWDISIEFLGSRTLSSASPWIIANKFDEEKQEGVIQVKRDHEDEIRAALTLIREFDSGEGFVEVKNVSGVLG
jgi:RNase P/RNase MRP subunit POP5